MDPDAQDGGVVTLQALHPHRRPPSRPSTTSFGAPKPGGHGEDWSGAKAMSVQPFGTTTQGPPEAPEHGSPALWLASCCTELASTAIVP